MDWLSRRKTKGLNTNKKDLEHGTKVRKDRESIEDKLEQLRQQRDIEACECDDISDVKFNKMF